MEMGVGGLRQHLVQVVEHFRERLLGSAWATACLAAVELLRRGEQRPSPAVLTVVPVARIHEILGHNVVVHGAKIGDMALIGMGSIILDHAEIGEGAIVAAGSVVLSGTKIGPHELWAGSPAKFKKMVDPAQTKEINVKIAKNHLMYSTW